MQLSDAVKSLAAHWKLAVSLMLLAIVGLAVFLVTRDQTRPPDRYRVAVDVLVPAIDSKGNRPEGVPPNLLQGNVRRALSPETEKRALDAANVPEKQRANIQFGFTSDPVGDIQTLSVTAADRDTALAVAVRFTDSYVQTRRESVASGAESGQTKARFAVRALEGRVRAVESSIRKADPKVAQMLDQAPGNGQVPPENLPRGTASDVVTDVVERNAMLSSIAGQRDSYAQNAISSLLPSGFATTVEVYPAQQITPALPSPTVPTLAFLGIGLLLALAVPILRDRLDHSVRTPQVAAGAFDAPVLTTIPHVARRFRQTLAEPGTPWDGAYRALAATSIATDRLPEAIVVTAPTGTIQDMVAANFAAALAGLGLRVALIATEPRQAWFLHDHAAEPTSPDLSFPDLLELAHQGRLNGALPRGLLKTKVQNLYVLRPGEPDREVGLDGLRPLLEAFLASNVDVTVIAGPALLEDPDATIFAWTTRSVLWAFEAGEVTEAEAKEGASRLALAGVTPFGVAMVNEA